MSEQDSSLTRGGPQEIPRPNEVEPGGAPPWEGLIGQNPQLSRAGLVRAFSGLTVAHSLSQIDGDRHRSAVAVVLSVSEGPLEDCDDVEVLLTRRSWSMRTHAGEVAFPGGVEDEGDSFPVGTALREACEEVALDRNGVDLIGALNPLMTYTSDRVVVPIVMMTTERPTVTASPDEVDEILHVRLADLLDPQCYHQELWTFAGIDGVPEAIRYPMHFFDIVGDTVWGATASMLHQLLSVIFAKRR